MHYERCARSVPKAGFAQPAPFRGICGPKARAMTLEHSVEEAKRTCTGT